VEIGHRDTLCNDLWGRQEKHGLALLEKPAAQCDRDGQLIYTADFYANSAQDFGNTDQ
jgi:hypothetical protein